MAIPALYTSPATALATETVDRMYSRHDFDTDRLFLRYDLAPDAIRSKEAALASMAAVDAANESGGGEKVAWVPRSVPRCHRRVTILGRKSVIFDALENQIETRWLLLYTSTMQ